MKKVIIIVVIYSFLLTACNYNKKIDTGDTGSNEYKNNIQDYRNTAQDDENIVKSDKTTDNNGTSRTTDTSENIKTNLTKEEYITKLNKLKSDLESSYQIYAEQTTLEMIRAGNAEYKLWDNMLNEIYSVLKGQLSKEEVDKLIDEEVNWIKIRDDKVVVDSEPYEGGSIKSLIEITSLIGSTKDRSYELVDKYMK